MSSSVYFVVEGPDGVGKTTVAKALAKRIREVTRELTFEITEPQKLAGTIGDEIRHRLSSGPRLDPWEAVGIFAIHHREIDRRATRPTTRSIM
jgi:thymidylate kinase